jgi:hypothetical protein
MKRRPRRAVQWLRTIKIPGGVAIISPRTTMFLPDNGRDPVSGLELLGPLLQACGLRKVSPLTYRGFCDLLEADPGTLAKPDRVIREVWDALMTHCHARAVEDSRKNAADDLRKLFGVQTVLSGIVGGGDAVDEIRKLRAAIEEFREHPETLAALSRTKFRDDFAVALAAIYRRYTVRRWSEKALTDFLQAALRAVGEAAPALRDREGKPTKPFGRAVLRNRE